MKYDFETIIDRAGKDSIAVDKHFGTQLEGFDWIPMWIADMNFATAPSIVEAIEKRLQHPLFGYFPTSKEYINAIINWQKVRNGVEGLTEENIGYENGVLGGVNSALSILASKGDSVLVHSPTYVGFTAVLSNNGYNIVHSPLVKDENNIYRMDFEDMEKRIVENKIHVAIFCSPYNPAGRVWERWEIEKAMELYKKHDVYVISDEIWSDLILEGHKHIPTQSISEDAKNRTIAFYAPSKTFSLAGLIGSYHIVYNSYLHDRLLKEESLCHYNSLNVLSQHALIGAYTQDGMDWLEQLRAVLTDNVNYACDFIEKHLDGVKVTKPQGTYMIFIDFEEYCQKHNVTVEEIINRGWNYGIGWQDGRAFLGNTNARINLALPKSRVIEAFDRLEKYVFTK